MVIFDHNPIIFLNKKKEEIQKDAYVQWSKVDYNGTEEIATGVGKTMIGIMAINQALKAGAKDIIVIVPKGDLLHQWAESISETLNIPLEDIGLVGGGNNDWKNITVAIINSVRNTFTKNYDLLILDEAHRYCSESNWNFVENNTFSAILSLTATVIRDDGEHHKLFKVAPLCFRYTQGQAIKDGILTEFNLTHKGVGLLPAERKKYIMVDTYIKNHFKEFNWDFGKVHHSVLHDTGLKRDIATQMLQCIQQRKQIVNNAANKVPEVINALLRAPNSKTIIFCESIKMAQKIKVLAYQYKIKSAIYHSKLGKKIKAKMFDDYKTNVVRVMIGVKSLDEGTNIPDSNFAIIVAGNKTKKGVIQRVGRCLRLSEGKTEADVLQLYVPRSKDEDWLRARSVELIQNAKTMVWEMA